MPYGLIADRIHLGMITFRIDLWTISISDRKQTGYKREYDVKNHHGSQDLGNL